MIGNPGLQKLSSIAVENADIYTIAAGVATIQQCYAIIAAESSTSDDLDTITLGSNFGGVGTYRPMIVIQADTGDTITVKHNTGNIFLYGAADIALTGNQILILFYNGSKWMDSAADSGGGGMTDFTVAGDSGTPQTIANGNTLSILGGTALSSVASATDTITINLDNTAVTPASYTNTNLTVDQQGRITAASNGTAGMTDFTVAGDTGTPQTIGNGNTLSILGGTGLSSVASATDTVTINLDNTAVTPASYTNTNLTVDAQGRITAASNGSGSSSPLGLKNGLALTKETAAIINVAIGNIEVNGTVVSKTAVTRLNMATNGDWIGGTSLESASEFANVFVDDAGNVKLYDKLPNYPRASTGSRVATMRVNQSGWNGTGGSGLNATSIVYDTDTGEGSVTAGMLLGIYTDSTYETGRGRGSAAAGSVNNASFALITAINTGTDTLTVEAGHNIAINDDDYLIVIEPGALEYANVSGTWWRFIARMFNDSSSDLDASKLTKRALAIRGGVADYTTSNTSFADIDSTNLVLPIFTSGGDIDMSFNAIVTGSGNTYLDYAVDGVRVGSTEGIALAQSIPLTTAMPWLVPVLPGTHTVAVQWRVLSGTASIYLSTVAARAQFSIKEIETQ